MAKRRSARNLSAPKPSASGYDEVLSSIVVLVDGARRTAARNVNAVMTATYWEIGRRILLFEQAGEPRAEYGVEVVKRLAADLTQRFGRGYSWRSLYKMRGFYLAYPEILPTVSAKSGAQKILSTLSAKSGSHEILQTVSAKFPGESLPRFPLPWSHYIRLLALKSSNARQFYEAEAIRGGWSVRQLERQIDTQFYERTQLSRNQAAMLAKGQIAKAEEHVTADEELKDPYVLEFLNLKDEYSETELEAALVANLEAFLMELGGDFAFVGRQRRLRIDDEWFRIDLLFFHRRLKCLVIIDLKLGKFTHADAGQMHLYLNYARQHWAMEGENPPIGIILCSSKGETLVKYALEGLPNKILAAEYLTALPAESVLASRMEETKRHLEKLPASTTSNSGKPKSRKTSK